MVDTRFAPRRSFAVSLTLSILFAAVFQSTASAQDRVSLLDRTKPETNWTFDNGREFPGATGRLAVDAESAHDGHPSLKLEGDFTAGGNYVQAGRKIDKVDIRELAMWVRNPDADTFTLRLTDAGGQAHQIVLRTEAGPHWQQVVLPLERFFARRGQADAVTNVAKYESWGGAKDGNWHGPATGIYFVAGKPAGGKTRTFWIGDVTIVPRPAEAVGAEQSVVLRLDEVVEDNHDWSVSLGGEVPGAKGSLTVAKDQPDSGRTGTALKLAGDFTGGGAYVAAIKNLKELDVKDITAFRLNVKSDNAAAVSIQMVDATGQTHQRKGVSLTADGAWHELVIKPSTIAGAEHWGGANDAKWHGPPQRLVLSVTKESDAKSKQPVVLLADVRAEALLPVFVQPPAFKEDFEGKSKSATSAAGAPTGGSLAGWTTAGSVAIDPANGFKSTSSLRLMRSLDDVEKSCSAISPAFSASPGLWQVGLATQSDLKSPDNSYNAVVQLECQDAGGKIIERLMIADVFGKHDWQPVSLRVEVPKGAASARFHVQLNKTNGTFRIDDLSASFLAPAPRRDDRISRLLFSTARLGNLLLPEDPRTVAVTVECRKPLRDDQHTLNYVVRDYWGAEQMQPANATLGKPEKKGDRIVYSASIDLAGANPEIGRYYELHAWIGQPGDEPFRNHTSFAILPEAATKKYKPEEIPFTSRSWDNRSAEYMRLADRLGIRICGVWGGWSAKPPFKPEAPGLDLVKELGMGWLTNTPIAEIERGKKDYSEEALRQGVRNLIEKYGQHRPMIINLGNEPHGTGERVLTNVAAYRTVYEEVKKVDSTIPVVATSVEPNEEYFRAGYGKWCDAYDFHIYETANDVRRTMREYKALMKKYGQERPLWSTELGLNSQGLTRHAVAVEVIKKTSVFFAEGGTSMSWFGFLYPDPDGKNEGSSGQAHNIFDSRFNRYCPKLDAVAFYNAINAISIKKFAAERQYPDGIQAFLFRDRDGRCLQVLWADHGRHDVAIPLPGVKQVQVIRIDGSRRMLDAAEKAITLTISEDPLLLLYDSGPATLPEALGTPLARIESPPAAVARGESIKVIVTSEEREAGVGVVAPPAWPIQLSQAIGQGNRTTSTTTVTVPRSTAAHQADLTVQIGPDDGRMGELYLRIPVSE